MLPVTDNTLLYPPVIAASHSIQMPDSMCPNPRDPGSGIHLTYLPNEVKAVPGHPRLRAGVAFWNNIMGQGLGGGGLGVPD